MRTYLSVVLLSLGVTACQVWNRDQPIETSLPPMSMEQADLNRDGNLDRTEFNQRLEILFEMRDVDEDGELARTELPSVSLVEVLRVRS